MCNTPFDYLKNPPLNMGINPHLTTTGGINSVPQQPSSVVVPSGQFTIPQPYDPTPKESNWFFLDGSTKTTTELRRSLYRATYVESGTENDKQCDEVLIVAESFLAAVQKFNRFRIDNTLVELTLVDDETDILI